MLHPCAWTHSAQRPAVKEEDEDEEEEGRHGCGISQPLPWVPRPSHPSCGSHSSATAPKHRKSPAEGTACAKAGLALGKDGAFPEQIKSSKTLSCQFEEAYAFCKFLES